MQWDKVKNVLIGILVAVNLFLLGSLGAKLWQERERAAALEASLHGLVQESGLTLAPSFRLPAERVLPELSLDRSRPDEQAVAAAMLGEADRTEQEDGTVRYESAQGWLVWSADGRVQGSVDTGTPPPEEESSLARRARSLLNDWGFRAEEAAWQTDGAEVTLTGTVVGLPVFNRTVTVRLQRDGTATLTGQWSFGTPYTTVNGSGVLCSAADALLEFAAGRPAAGELRSMTAGYRMQTDSSRRLQLIPTWKIGTDSGDYLVDCDKKTVVG